MQDVSVFRVESVKWLLLPVRAFEVLSVSFVCFVRIKALEQ